MRKLSLDDGVEVLADTAVRTASSASSALVGSLDDVADSRQRTFHHEVPLLKS